MRSNPREDTPRVLAVAAIFFGALAALGWAEGIYARLDSETLAALALFAIAFAAATYALDRQVRACINRALRFRTRSAKSPGAKRAAT